MSSLPDVLQEEWRRRIANNVEAKRASDELKFHKTKVRKMREELGVADEREKELQRRLNNVEKKLEPSLRKIVESFESYNQIEESILEEAVTEDHERLVAVLRKKAMTMDEMDRAQLLAFVKTLLSVREEGAGPRRGDHAGDGQRRPQAARPRQHRLAGGERVGGRAPQEAHQGGGGGSPLHGQDGGPVPGEYCEQ